MNPKEFSDKKNGRLIKSPTGYWAFGPSPLTDTLELSGAVVTRLAEAAGRLGELSGLCYRLPNPQLLSGAYVMREAEKSSLIEGTVSTVSDLYLFELEPDNTEPVQDLMEVLNYVVALRYALERRQSLPLSLRLIREIHERLMQHVRGKEKQPGEFRTSQNWIGGSRPDNARYTPPPPDDMRDALDAFEKYLYRSEPNRIHPLIECAQVHYQFEAIHPFNDGNGRIGRLLITLLCIERGLLSEPLLYLSAYFEAHRNEYYDRLLSISQHGEWNEWFMFFLTGVSEQAQDAKLRAVRILDLQTEYTDLELTPTARKVCDILFANPYINSSVVQNRFGVSNPTANEALELLELRGVLKKHPPQRQRGQRYVAHDILSAFSGEAIEKKG
jgi:Fic family protein